MCQDGLDLKDEGLAPEVLGNMGERVTTFLCLNSDTVGGPGEVRLPLGEQFFAINEKYGDRYTSKDAREEGWLVWVWLLLIEVEGEYQVRDDYKGVSEGEMIPSGEEGGVVMAVLGIVLVSSVVYCLLVVIADDDVVRVEVGVCAWRSENMRAAPQKLKAVRILKILKVELSGLSFFRGNLMGLITLKLERKMGSEKQ